MKKFPGEDPRTPALSRVHVLPLKRGVGTPLSILAIGEVGRLFITALKPAWTNGVLESWYQPGQVSPQRMDSARPRWWR